MSESTEASTAATMPPDLDALNHKLDVLSVQVGYLIEQAQVTARKQQERAELVQDVLPIANDAIGLVTEQLAEIQEYIDLSDILRLGKRILRSGRDIDRMLDQLESLMDLAQTVGPLTSSILDKVTNQLEVAEERGYFALARGAARAVDRVAASMTPADVERLAENVVVLAGVFKELDQPVDPSMRSLMRQLRDPDVRRGLAKVMGMLGAFGARTATQQQPAAAVQSGVDK